MMQNVMGIQAMSSYTCSLTQNPNKKNSADLAAVYLFALNLLELVLVGKAKVCPVVWLGRRGFNSRHFPDADYLLC
jgi:hypothetical protein